MPGDLPLFAYGTLLTGALDPDVDRLLRKHACRLGPARLHGRLHDQGGYPGLVCHPAGGGQVCGELLELLEPERTLARLDRYEGFDPARPHAGEFVRARHVVESGDARREAWVYLLNTRQARPGSRIVGGDWRRYKSRSCEVGRLSG